MDAIQAFCQRWHIADLALSGSVLRADFRDDSDIDVLVGFHDDTRYTLFDLVKMSDELETILGRSVDLVDRQAVEQSPNYSRRTHILSSAEVVYAER